MNTPYWNQYDHKSGVWRVLETLFFWPSYQCTATGYLDESGGFELRYDLKSGLPRTWGTNGPTQIRQTHFNISKSMLKPILQGLFLWLTYPSSVHPVGFGMFILRKAPRKKRRKMPAGEGGNSVGIMALQTNLLLIQDSNLWIKTQLSICMYVCMYVCIYTL